ncbi:MAG: aminoacyl-tRNA hydrolase [Candidatus Moranbacteria bacterium]|nr:aminoacyl-tRNA hydrolase [Candidatus Moranbacteria bacterium]
MRTVLIAGLGNPGGKYASTRHNAGFMLVDHFFEKYRDNFAFSEWEFSKKLKAEISIGKHEDNKYILLKPRTFMNLSGESVSATKKYYKVKIEDIIVAHDDIDISLGKYKIAAGSSSAGHNGVQNIIEMLGTKDFTRVRIGIENRGEKKIETEKYVLGKFTTAEIKKISGVISEIQKELAGKFEIRV